MNLYNYSSPPWETSLYKGIPIGAFTPALRAELKAALGPGMYVKYRGPRPDTGRTRLARQGTCLKQDAVTVTVYQKRNGYGLLQFTR